MQGEDLLIPPSLMAPQVSVTRRLVSAPNFGVSRVEVLSSFGRVINLGSERMRAATADNECYVCRPRKEEPK